MRVLHRRHHASGHLRGLHAKLGVDARDDDVQVREQLFILVESPVLQDVDLYARQYAKRGQFLVERRDDRQLATEPFCGQTARQ